MTVHDISQANTLITCGMISKYTDHLWYDSSDIKKCGREHCVLDHRHEIMRDTPQCEVDEMEMWSWTKNLCCLDRN